MAKVGDEVAKMDELGYFDLGSQVILSLPKEADVLFEGSPRLFPGDPIADCGKAKELPREAHEPTTRNRSFAE